MEIRLLNCPLCTTPHFGDVDSLRTTLVRVSTNIITCPICHEKLLGLDKLTIHLFTHIEENNKCQVISEDPVKCDICNFIFTDKNILEIHQKLLHQTTPDSHTGCYSYHCHICSKKFKMRGSLMVHLRVAHYGFSKKNCENGKESEVRQPSDTEGDKEVKIDEKGGQNNKQWECDVCFKLFTTKYFLKKHKRLHTGEMPYCCKLCNKSFTFQQSYHKHMLYHTSEKPHICNECGRAFKELSTLQNHVRIHSGERPFVCETCGKSFRQRVSYLVHRRIHTGVMPYKCSTCDKSFRYKVSQKSHKCLPEQTNISQNIVTTQNVNIPLTNESLDLTNGSLAKNNLDISQIIPKCIMNVDLDTGNISVVPHAQISDQGIERIEKKSIFLNNNEHIEISYNKADLGTTRVSSNNDVNTGKVRDVESQDDFENLLYTSPTEKDIFCPSLSNLLPEVESLYLSNSPTNNIPGEHENINDMREKCLEEFLKDME